MPNPTKMEGLLFHFGVVLFLFWGEVCRFGVADLC